MEGPSTSTSGGAQQPKADRFNKYKICMALEVDGKPVFVKAGGGGGQGQCCFYNCSLCTGDTKVKKSSHLAHHLRVHHKALFETVEAKMSTVQQVSKTDTFCVMCGQSFAMWNKETSILSMHRRRHSNLGGQYGCTAYRQFFGDDGFARILRAVEGEHEKSTAQSRAEHLANLINHFEETEVRGSVYVWLPINSKICVDSIQYIGKSGNIDRRILAHQLARRLAGETDGDEEEASGRRYILICSNVPRGLADLMEFLLLSQFPISELFNANIPYGHWDDGVPTIRDRSPDMWLQDAAKLLMCSFDDECEKIERGESVAPSPSASTAQTSANSVEELRAALAESASLLETTVPSRQRSTTDNDELDGPAKQRRLSEVDELRASLAKSEEALAKAKGKARKFHNQLRELSISPATSPCSSGPSRNNSPLPPPNFD